MNLFSFSSLPVQIHHLRPTPPLHPRIQVGRGHAEPVGVDPTEVMHGTPEEGEEDVRQDGEVVLIDIESDVG